MLGTLWHLVPARIRREAVRQIAIIAASSTERLETRIRFGESALAAFHEEEDSHQADIHRRLQHLDQSVHGFDARLLGIESGLATLREITDHLERVAMPAAMSRAQHHLDQSVHGFDARLLGIESGLATLREITDHLERVAMPAAMSRAEALERKVSHIEATDS